MIEISEKLKVPFCFARSKPYLWPTVVTPIIAYGRVRTDQIDARSDVNSENYILISHAIVGGLALQGPVNWLHHPLFDIIFHSPRVREMRVFDNQFFNSAVDTFYKISVGDFGPGRTSLYIEYSRRWCLSGSRYVRPESYSFDFWHFMNLRWIIPRVGPASL